jgi:hypothetical protein
MKRAEDNWTTEQQSEGHMTITAVEAQERALKKVAAMKRLSKELSAIMDELPVPTVEEFEAIREKQAPWTLEAYVAAVIRNVDFYVDEARAILEGYISSETEESLAAAPKFGRNPEAHLERSLRYVVETRFQTQIPPSKEEELYFRPNAAKETLMGIFISKLMDLWQAEARRSLR